MSSKAASGNNETGSPTSDQTTSKELQEAEKRLKDLEQREAALKKRESDITAKEKDLQAVAQQKNVGQNGQAPGGQTPPQNQQCDHKVYPPPRKLQKKVVGFLYEGSTLPARVKAK